MTMNTVEQTIRTKQRTELAEKKKRQMKRQDDGFQIFATFQPREQCERSE